MPIGTSLASALGAASPGDQVHGEGSHPAGDGRAESDSENPPGHGAIVTFPRRSAERGATEQGRWIVSAA